MLQKQFRPPINKVVIEVPAGLVDAGEGAAESAVRELKEETGYVGTVDKDGWGVGCVMFNGTLTLLIILGEARWLWGWSSLFMEVGRALWKGGPADVGMDGRSGILQYESEHGSR